jgi:thiol:disulfide interchange protein
MQTVRPVAARSVPELMMETLDNERDGGFDEEVCDKPSSPLPRIVALILVIGAAFAGWRYLGPKNALAQGGWIQDWDQAVEQSKKSGKPALVLFTADWCPACDTFKSQVLSDANVQRHLSDNYTLVVVDVTDRTGANARRAAEFNVRGIPALILYNESGQEVARGPGMPGDVLLSWLRSGGTALRFR